jgi:nitroreductase
MFNDVTTPLSLLQTRRSVKPRDMIAPGPDADQLRTILSVATRVPDHGKLAPWRFVIIGNDQRTRLATVLTEAYRAEKPDAGRLEIEAIEAFAHQAPVLVVVLSSPVRESKIPLWEQELSAGAACMNLLTAAHALGFVGGWITGWAAYSAQVRDSFGTANERMAGFMFLGSPKHPLEERPRPKYEHIVWNWD